MNVELINDDDAEEIKRINPDMRTYNQKLCLEKWIFNDKFKYCDSDWLFKRYKNQKERFYFDLLLNNNHSENDIMNMIMPDITEKQRNKQNIDIVYIKQFLNVINENNEKDIYTEEIDFKGETLNTFLKNNPYKNKTINLKQFIKLFSRSLFSIKKMKRKQIRKDGKRIEDTENINYILTSSIKKKCNTTEYKLSKHIRENKLYKVRLDGESFKGEIDMKELEKYNDNEYNEVIKVLKEYKKEPKLQLKGDEICI